MRFIYYIACLSLYVVCLPLLVLTSFKPKHRLSIPRRFFPFLRYFLRFFGKDKYSGFCDKFAPQVWLHACSYGEVKSLEPLMFHLLGELKQDFTTLQKTDLIDSKTLRPRDSKKDSIKASKTPQILITTITHTGYSLAKQTYQNYQNVRIEFLPFEIFLPFYAKRFHRKSNDKDSSALRLLCVFEAELWLNLFALAKHLDAHTMLLNARISSRSYPRYKKFSFFYRHIFALIDEVFAQSDEDKARLESLGAKHIQVIGNLKLYSTPKVTHNYTKPNGVLFLAASTHEGEEELVIDAFIRAFSDNVAKSSKQDSPNTIDSSDFGDTFLAIAPRHPERFSQVASLLESKKLKFTRLTQGYENAFKNNTKILLIDKLGELNNFYALSQVTVLCGSFVKVGGHNPLEPAHFNNVLISGEHIFNQKTLFASVQNAYIIPQDKLESTLKNYQHLKQSHIDSSTSSLPKVLESLELHLHTKCNNA